MPSVSKTQQRLMGMAYAVRKFLDGDKENGLNPDEIDSQYKEEVLNIANQMNKKDLKDFAKTSHKNLPNVKEHRILSFDDFMKL